MSPPFRTRWRYAVHRNCARIYEDARRDETADYHEEQTGRIAGSLPAESLRIPAALNALLHLSCRILIGLEFACIVIPGKADVYESFWHRKHLEER